MSTSLEPAFDLMVLARTRSPCVSIARARSAPAAVQADPEDQQDAIVEVADAGVRLTWASFATKPHAARHAVKDRLRALCAKPALAAAAHHDLAGVVEILVETLNPATLLSLIRTAEVAVPVITPRMSAEITAAIEVLRARGAAQAAERAEAEAAAVFVELLELACDDGCSMSLNPKPEPQPEPEPEPESEPDSTPEPGPEPEPKPETVIQEDWKGFTPEPEQAKVEDDATNHLGIHLGTFDVIDEAPTDHHFIAQPAASGSTNRKMLKRVAQEWGQLQMGL